METKEIIGKIERVRKDRKALALQFENWFQSFKPLTEEFNIGDEVKIVYSIKDKFQNIKKIEKVIHEQKQIKPIIITREIEKPKKSEIDFDLSIPVQTKNTILMNVSSIITTEINNGTKFTESELNSKILRLTEVFTQAYKNIV